jgi:hypothetical protein
MVCSSSRYIDVQEDEYRHPRKRTRPYHFELERYDQDHIQRNQISTEGGDSGGWDKILTYRSAYYNVVHVQISMYDIEPM